MSEELVVQELPQDVLVQILYRLPAKSLVRFTSVCKEWFSMIKSHEFALKQHNATRANLYKNNFQFFIASQTSSSTDNSNFLWLLYYDSFEIFAKFKCSPCERIFISNPCNGIVCLYISGNRNAGAFLLWNPTTREVRPLPFLLPPTIPPTQAPNYIRFSFSSYGLGFDPVSKDYKVFVVLNDLSDIYPDYVPVEIYNLRTDSWKLLPENSFHHSMLHCNRSVVLYGSVCSWINSRQLDSLISFDFVEETFIKTQYPERFLKSHECDFLPVLLQSNKEDAKPHVMCWFCTSYTLGDRRDIEIWVLDGYGTNGRWSLHNVIEFQHYESIYGPWGYWQGEELLLQQSYSAEENYVELPFLSYNPTTKCLKNTSYEKAGDLVYGHGFIESIVSITGGSQQHDEFDHGQDGSPESFLTFNLQEVDTPAASSTTHRYYYPKWYLG